MTTVLFTQKNSVYSLLGCDCYDMERDALTWVGTEPAIYHPPCRLFSRMRKFSTAPDLEKELAYWAVDRVRKFGGVLEHPSKSILWIEKNLPAPGTSDQYGFSIDLDQYWFGHRAQKRTWLYIVGISPKQLPEYPIALGKASYIVGKFRSHTLPEVSKHERHATPEGFAKWLIEIVKLIKSNHEN